MDALSSSWGPYGRKTNNEKLASDHAKTTAHDSISNVHKTVLYSVNREKTIPIPKLATWLPVVMPPICTTSSESVGQVKNNPFVIPFPNSKLSTSQKALPGASDNTVRIEIKKPKKGKNIRKSISHYAIPYLCAKSANSFLC